MRRTKIVCTIGPASESPTILARLVREGMDVARLNFSHGSHDSHAEKIRLIRRLAGEAGRPVAILQDLAGPKIRIGALAEGAVTLRPEDRLVLTTRPVPGDAREISVTYKGLPEDVRAGDTLLLADGALDMLVEGVEGPDIHCRVVTGGVLGSHKGINLPSRSIRAPILTDKDRRDLAFGLGQGVDFIALSFVRSAADIAVVREVMDGLGRRVPLIAKIEKHEALDELDAIVEAADGLMVARGDLGVDIPLERVPRVQKRLIEKANLAGKPVITATQMLKSMVEAPRPTRAEVTDVANAILDGTDAIMLSEETAAGAFPVQAVRVMAKVAADVEPLFDHQGWNAKLKDATRLSFEAAVAHTAVEMATDIGAAAILTCTTSGSTTRLVARYRPRQPLLAMTPHPKTAMRLALTFGAVPVLMPETASAEDLERRAIGAALQNGYVKPGQPVVITAGLPFNVSGTTNIIKVATAEWD